MMGQCCSPSSCLMARASGFRRFIYKVWLLKARRGFSANKVRWLLLFFAKRVENRDMACKGQDICVNLHNPCLSLVEAVLFMPNLAYASQ